MQLNFHVQFFYKEDACKFSFSAVFLFTFLIGVLILSSHPLQAKSFAYIGADNEKLYVIDQENKTIVQTLSFDCLGYGTVVSADGMRVYISVNQACGASNVAVIDTNTYQILAAIPANDPNGLALSPSGDRLYISTNDNTLKIINTADFSEVTSINLTPDQVMDAGGVVITSDNSKVYVALIDGLAVVDVATLQVTKIALQTSAYQIAISPDNSLLYVTNGSPPGKISVIDGNTDTLVETIDDVQEYTVGVQFSKDGQKVYVGHVFSNPNLVKIYDAPSHSLIDSVTLGGSNMEGLDVSPNGEEVWVVSRNDDTIYILDTQSQSLKTQIQLPFASTPLGLGRFFGPELCGNGHLEDQSAGEGCDDGNVIGGDGCSSTCTIETGFSCTGTPSTCTSTCGDGLQASDEACDDGDMTNNDGCSSTCTVEEGFTCILENGTRSDCAPNGSVGSCSLSHIASSVNGTPILWILFALPLIAAAAFRFEKRRVS